MAKPMLVTGSHRSGTTWVGQMLAVSPHAHYVHEPFAPMNERTWLRDPTSVQYLHIPATASHPAAHDLQRIAALRPPLGHMLARSPRPRHLVRVTQQAVEAARARRRGARAVIKDPFALLMAEWIQARVGADVVVLVRHPAAFASSIKRLGWRLDPAWLLDQPAVMAGPVGRYRTELEAEAGLDIVDHACLIWRVLARVAEQYERDHPDWTVLPYETLAVDPVARFRDLYATLGLPWTQHVADAIAARNDASNVHEVAAGNKGGTTRDSRQAMWTWRDRLSDEEIRRVRERTADVAEHWYGDDAWWPDT